MLLRTLATLSLLAVTVIPALGDDKKEPPKEQHIKGKWVKNADGIDIQFDFKKHDQLIVSAGNNENNVVITCKCEVTKDGRVKAEVTEVKESGEFPAKPEVGYKFQFTFKTDKETAKLTDFEADNAEQVRQIIEGEYTSKKDD